MPMPWFRMYAEAVDDDKLRLLAFEDRWHFVALLCLKCSSVLDGDPQTLERRIAVKLGLRVTELDEVKRRLREVGLIDEKWQPLAWGRRQFESDHNGAKRTKKWRENKKKQPRDVTVTTVKRHSDGVDTDTDTEKNSVRASPPDPPSLDAALFAEARKVFGRSTGGMINTAIREKGKPWLVDLVEKCRGKDPEAARAYLAAAMKPQERKAVF